MVRLSKPLYLSSPIVSIVSSIVMGFGMSFIMKQDVSGALPYFVPGLVGSLYAGIVALIFYYKIWESIQDGHARTSPGKAIGFLFIPLFQFYWIFQVIWGFSKDYNTYVDRHGVNTKKLPEGLFLAFSILPFALWGIYLAFSILAFTTWIPFLNTLINVVYSFVFMMVVATVCDAVNAIPLSQGMDLPLLSDPMVGPVGAAGPIGVRPRAKLGARPLALYCVSGEFAHETVIVPADGVSIGRDPSRVNLVLAGSEISGVHARVLPEPSSAQMWLEDLHSLNGTFYCPRIGSGEESESGWIQLQGKILLSPGARFRLAIDGPEFEIRGS
jgi:hypothetical protein